MPAKLRRQLAGAHRGTGNARHYAFVVAELLVRVGLVAQEHVLARAHEADARLGLYSAPRAACPRARWRAAARRRCVPAQLREDGGDRAVLGRGNDDSRAALGLRQLLLHRGDVCAR